MIECSPSQLQQATDCASPMLTKCTPSLSPLRTHRPHTRQATARVATSRDDRENTQDEQPVRLDSTQEDRTRTPTIVDQIAHDAAISQQVEDRDKQHARDVAKAYKQAQLEQIHHKEHRRRESKLEAQQITEQLAWEQAQIDFMYQAQKELDRSVQCDLKELQERTLEIHRRRASAARITQHFFDRLAVLEPVQAMERFAAKQQELVSCCAELMQGITNKTEFEAFMQEIRATVLKEDALLRHRLRAKQREEQVITTKMQAIAELKRAQLHEIIRHEHEASTAKLQDQALRMEIVQQQQAQDRRVEAQRSRKKKKNLELSLKLQEQMRRNRAEQAVVSLRIDGTMSPILRTPFWSDDSIDGQRESFQREPARASTAVSRERPVIFAKKTQRWYD